MDRLPAVIGPAPSELSFEELCEKLRKERVRVTSSLQTYLNRPSKVKKKASPRKSSKNKAIMNQMAEAGLTIEDLLRELNNETT